MKILTQYKIQIPTQWNDLKVYQMVDLLELDSYKDEYSGYDFLIEQISILTELDSDNDIFFQLTEEELTLIQKELKWISTSKYLINTKKYFECNNFKYKKIDFTNMLVAEYITLDYYVTNTPLNFIREFITTCYRRYKIDEFGNEIMEPFTFDFEQRKYEFDQLPLDIFPLQEFIDFRNDCLTSFDLLHKTETLDDEDLDDEEDEYIEENEELNFREQQALEEAKQQEAIKRIFNWEKIFMNLTNNNIVESHKVLDLPILYLFRIITMLKHIKD